ncbi:hypothetical protein [Falsiruegeria mediterranea]
MCSRDQADYERAEPVMDNHLAFAAKVRRPPLTAEMCMTQHRLIKAHSRIAAVQHLILHQKAIASGLICPTGCPKSAQSGDGCQSWLVTALRTKPPLASQALTSPLGTKRCEAIQGRISTKKVPRCSSRGAPLPVHRPIHIKAGLALLLR